MDSKSLLSPTLTDATGFKLGVLDILGLYGFDAPHPSKLVRHQVPYLDELIQNGWFDHYQSLQSRNRFHGSRTVVSFLGLSGDRAAFHGVYNVRGQHPASVAPRIDSCPWSSKWHEEAEFFYDLERDSRFDDLRDRLIIDWGRGTRSWVQKLSNKRLLEIQEPGRRLPPFDDYLEFSLSYGQLQDLFQNEEAHREWRARLSAVAGVYLILAETTGDLYVGSACGEAGIWGRWRDYAKSGHGHNTLLRRLVEREPAYPGAFRFSILQILPKTISRDEVIRRESMYKQKLGTRATGLNLN